MTYPSRLALLILGLACVPSAADAPVVPITGAKDATNLPANQWVLLDVEPDDSGGKRFASAAYAPNAGRILLWGTGGKKPANNLYLRYELESFDPEKPGWSPAFPESRVGQWKADDFPPFRIHGQSGPDKLKHDEGPRLQVVSGYASTNRIRWWDFDGVWRPSPIHTFNMAAYDSRRGRIIYYSDGQTFALDPKSHTWTDLKTANHPTTARHVAWASMAYDPVNDEVLLFGGGLATNPTGACPTWLYDCTANTWRRPKLDVEPPPRCNAPIVFDPATKSLVMFGGYNQSAALNDTWVYDCAKRAWSRREPKASPPPMFAPAAAALPGGKVLVCGADARKLDRSHDARSQAVRETWIYDAAADAWTPVDGGLSLSGYDWLTATTDEQHGLVYMVAFGSQRRTFAFRYDAASLKPAALEGAAPGAVAWKYPDQKGSLESAPPADPAAHARVLASLPPNTFVDAQPPGLLVSKTWSTAVLDTDRSEVLYTGGGHSGYSGNDIARYSIAANRWSQDMPPRFPPFLEGTNAGIFGWSYGMVPFSQHTYLWYCYDPASKTMLYLARPSIPDGQEVQLTDDPKDVFIYDHKQHGYESWVYDPAKKRMHRPSFGRTFVNPWHLSLIGTPKGVYAMAENALYHGRIDRESGAVAWRTVDGRFPKPSDSIKYHYEFQPLVHDTKRDRLIQLKGDGSRVDVFTRSLADDGEWKQLPTTGNAFIGREVVYIAKHDTVLWLGEKLFALDCGTNEMRQIDVSLPKGSYGHECAMVYDAKHDVCIALIPRSFSGPMGTYLFRYEPPKAK